MTLDTWVSFATLLAALSGFYWALRRDFDRRFAEVDRRFDQVDNRFTQVDDRISRLEKRVDDGFSELRTEIKADIHRLDDRVYALAAGLKPTLEQASGE